MVIAILAFITITGRDFSSSEHTFAITIIGWLLDVITDVALNSLVLWLIFTGGNWVYRKYRTTKPN